MNGHLTLLLVEVNKLNVDSETEAGHNYSLLSCHRMSKHKQTQKVWVEKEENISPGCGSRTCNVLETSGKRDLSFIENINHLFYHFEDQTIVIRQHFMASNISILLESSANYFG